MAAGIQIPVELRTFVFANVVGFATWKIGKRWRRGFCGVVIGTPWFMWSFDL